MSRIFFEELVKAIPRVPGYEGSYRIHVIDLVNNRPADVPPGGFPPYVCPSPSITAGAAYAITGEVGEDKDYPGEYWVRVYLWQMDKGRLIVSDMVNASDRESCASSYPYILAYLFSTVDEVKLAAAPAPAAAPMQKPVSEAENHWLYLGVRGGGGNASWDVSVPIGDDPDDYDDDGNPIMQTITTGCLNINGALLLGVNIIPQFSIQVEANINAYFDFEEMGLYFWHLTVPVLFKYNWRNDPIKASVYAGPYMSLPLVLYDTPYDHVDFYKLIGISAGVSAGRKLGPGYFFVDCRLNHLLFLSDDEENSLKHPYKGAVFSIGYELGLIKRK
jgi:hypothetical protein